MFFLNFLLAFSFAQNPLVKNSEACKCVSEIEDPYEQAAVFNYGKNLNLCIDSCRFRPVKILKKFKSRVEFANLLHFGLFYKTSFNFQDLKSVSVGFENFTPGVNHVVLKFDFKKPMQLFEQTTGEVYADPQESIIVSSEGVPGRGRDYSLLEGFLGEYLVVTRFVTGSEYKRWTKLMKNPVQFHKLEVTQSQIEKALLNALEDSFEKGINEKYQLFTNNCSMKAYSFLELQKPNDLSLLQKVSLALPIDGPVSTLQFLKSEKLILLHHKNKVDTLGVL